MARITASCFAASPGVTENILQLPVNSQANTPLQLLVSTQYTDTKEKSLE